MTEWSEASGTTEPESGSVIHSVRPPWCWCTAAYHAHGLRDPSCRHEAFEDYEDRIRTLHAQLDMVLRWHAGFTLPPVRETAL